MIHPRRQHRDAHHGEVTAPSTNSGALGAGDCPRHDGIAGNLPCCVRAGHEPPCVAAAAHVMFGVDAVVVVMPSAADARRAWQLAALRFSARVLADMGATDGAALLRTRAVAVSAGFSAAPREICDGDSPSYPGVDDALHRARATGESFSVKSARPLRGTGAPATVAVPDPLDSFDDGLGDWPEETVVADISASLRNYDDRPIARK